MIRWKKRNVKEQLERLHKEFEVTVENLSPKTATHEQLDALGKRIGIKARIRASRDDD